MNYKMFGHSLSNVVIDMTQAFFPNEKYDQIDDGKDSEKFLVSSYSNGMASALFYENGVLKGRSEVYCDNDISRGIKLSIYKLFGDIKNTTLPWGLLTGIRPAKIALALLESGFSENEIIEHLREKYLISFEKSQLCLGVAKLEKEVIKKSYEHRYSVYIGIPFCPSRCLYCSFTAYPIEKYAHKTENYINKLRDEIRLSKDIFSDKMLETIYIGGGTPTSLDNKNFEALLKLVSENFNSSYLREFTVEAGRPDSITEYKLDVMKAYSVSRISINPQTINNTTLEAIGRKHSDKDFYNAFNLSRKKGFKHINTDLILGLDHENIKDVENTFRNITELSPEEITVHTLSVKRASKLKEELSERNLPENSLVEEMLNISRQYMSSFGYRPYYMYRQKNMLGNFENIGYSKPGYEGVYNILIMGEYQSILAFGAGAISKFVSNSTGRIERAFNVKNVDEYIDRIDEMVRRKKNQKEMLTC